MGSALRTAYDSTNIYDIPTSAQMVGYYVDGIYAVSELEVRARFPNATLIGISAVGTNAGIVGDVEPGCMDPTYAVQWVQWRRAAGFDPTIYCNQLHGWNPVRVAFQAAGVPPPHYWVANYDGVASIPAGAVAKQYANPTLTGGHYDLSAVADSWPGVDGLFGGGGGTILGDLTDQEHKWLENITNEVLALVQVLGVQVNPGAQSTSKRLDDMQAAIAKLQAGGGIEAPEPAEPKSVTGTFTGTLT